MDLLAVADGAAGAIDPQQQGRTLALLYLAQGLEHPLPGRAGNGPFDGNPRQGSAGFAAPGPDHQVVAQSLDLKKGAVGWQKLLVLRWLLMVLPFALWGTAMAAMKPLLTGATPLTIAWMRLLPAGLLLLLVAVLLKLNVDGEGDAHFFGGVVTALCVAPVALPLAMRLYLRFMGGGLEARALVRDAGWDS